MGKPALLGGFIYVADSTAVDPRILRVDPASGDREVVSSNTVGAKLSGATPNWSQPSAVVAVDGTLYVLDRPVGSIIAVDPMTGDRVLLASGFGNANQGSDLAVHASGDLLHAEFGSSCSGCVGQHVSRIDRSTGIVTVFSSNAIGGVTGPDYGIRVMSVASVGAPPPDGIATVDHMVFNPGPPQTVREDNVIPPFSVALVDADGDLVGVSTNQVTLTLTKGTSALQGTLSKAAVGGVATFDDLVYPTSETIEVDVSSDGAPTLQLQIIVLPFLSDLRLLALTVDPAAPPAGEPTLVHAVVRNAGQEPGQARVRFFEGDPAFGGTSIGVVDHSVPVGQQVTFGITWTPAVEGTRLLYAQVENLAPPEATPSDNAGSVLVPVGAAPEELSVEVGEVFAFPGASLEVPVAITNVGSGPATIQNVILGGPSYLSFVAPLIGETLDPGSTEIAVATLDIPAGTPAPPLGDAPLVEPLAITVTTTSGAFTDDLVVKLFDAPAASLLVRVLDATTGAPVGGALVAVQGLAQTFATNATGEVTVFTSPGSGEVFAYQAGFIAKAVSVDVAEGSAVLEIALEPGQTLGVTQVVSEPLSTDEIAARGIVLDDPVNNHVVDFVVSMEVGPPLVVPSIVIPNDPPPGTVVQFSQVVPVPPSAPDPSDPNPEPTVDSVANLVGTIQFHDFGRTETFLVVRGQVFALKEFFDVACFVVNNAVAPDPSDILLEDVEVALAVPAGVGLPELNGVAQATTQTLGTLEAGESAQATWVVRGDLPGDYDLTASVAADLVVLGVPQVTLTASATADVEVALPNLFLEFETPDTVDAGSAFAFGVLVTNLGARTANHVRVVISDVNLSLCFLDPNLQPEATLSFDGDGNATAVVNLGDIPPGETRRAELRLVALVSGTVHQVATTVAAATELTGSSVAVEPFPPPTISTGPTSQTVCDGAGVVFAVVAEGVPPLTFQWRRDGVDLVGATSASLSLSAATSADEGSYDVVVTNAGGSIVSAAATLTVLAAPSIVASPLSATVLAGDPVVLTVSASGDGPLTFQWRRDGVDLEAETASTLTLAAATDLDAGAYDVVVTNACGSATSAAADLVVLTPDLAIGGFVLQSQTRVTRFEYDYVYKAQATNSSGFALANVTATLVGVPAHVTILDGSLAFGAVDDDQVATSMDTFTVRIDRRFTTNLSTFVFATDADLPLSDD